MENRISKVIPLDVPNQDSLDMASKTQIENAGMLDADRPIKFSVADGDRNGILLVPVYDSRQKTLLAQFAGGPTPSSLARIGGECYRFGHDSPQISGVSRTTLIELPRPEFMASYYANSFPIDKSMLGTS
jgi:hypothetical protein